MSDMFVFMSSMESFGIVVIEAMAAHTLVPYREIVIDAYDEQKTLLWLQVSSKNLCTFISEFINGYHLHLFGGIIVAKQDRNPRKG